jgi:hypothetical protein
VPRHFCASARLVPRLPRVTLHKVAKHPLAPRTPAPERRLRHARKLLDNVRVSHPDPLCSYYNRTSRAGTCRAWLACKRWLPRLLCPLATGQTFFARSYYCTFVARSHLLSVYIQCVSAASSGRLSSHRIIASLARAIICNRL